MKKHTNPIFALYNKHELLDLPKDIFINAIFKYNEKTILEFLAQTTLIETVSFPACGNVFTVKLLDFPLKEIILNKKSIFKLTLEKFFDNKKDKQILGEIFSKIQNTDQNNVKKFFYDSCTQEYEKKIPTYVKKPKICTTIEKIKDFTKAMFSFVLGTLVFKLIQDFSIHAMLLTSGVALGFFAIPVIFEGLSHLASWYSKKNYREARDNALKIISNSVGKFLTQDKEIEQAKITSQRDLMSKGDLNKGNIVYIN